ncbi:MAG: DUF998 domain-containing protein [Candidatus Marsarchaeota archaeon]|nr:DUF998 domain-containing protein [Candidatus Marsarchaeota archaeon]MCL5094543.1 DUF998 domain-containing protein [Candidatus Marsarchaeota archaeon]
MDKKILLLFGIFAIISVFIWISSAMIINPSFNFFKGALSQLGSSGANNPWVYNIGLIFTAVLLFIFAIGLLLYSKNKIEEVGSSFLMVAAIFLALIGIFHGGTYPHDFVSVYFFVQSGLSIIIWGLGLLFNNKKQGISILLIAFIAIGIAEIIKNFVSTAVIETFGTAVIGLFAVLMILFLKNRE